MKIKILSTASMALLTFGTINALTFTQEGISYETRSVSGETVVNVIENTERPYDGTLAIPEFVVYEDISYKVYGIKNLGNAKDLNSISIPASSRHHRHSF